MDPHLAYTPQKPEDPFGEPPPPAPDRPSGSTGDPQHTRDEPTTASPAPAPAPASAGADTGAEAHVPATTRAQRLASRRGVSGAERVAGCPGTAPPPSRCPSSLVVNTTTRHLLVMGSIFQLGHLLGKDNAEVPGSIPGAPEAWQRLSMCLAMVSAGSWLPAQRVAGHGRWITIRSATRAPPTWSPIIVLPEPALGPV